MKLSSQQIDKWLHEGWFQVDDLFPESIVSSIEEEFENLLREGQFRSASIGGKQILQNDLIRGDQIFWIESQFPHWCSFLEMTLEQFNQELNLGLTKFETHAAIYPPGAEYQEHLDQSTPYPGQKSLRKISLVFYLNESWKDSEGGELQIQTDQRFKILPERNRLVCFDSGQIWHEVRPSHRTRKSLTAWLTRPM